MPTVQLDGEALRRQLEEVLKDPGFARNERLSRFLSYLIERHLEGCDHELKESVIGVEVFGRSPEYNPKHDPIVRTEARRLRVRLEDYYEGVGKCDAVVIEVPKGGYVPVVRVREVQSASTAVGAGRTSSRLRWAAGSAGAMVALAIIAWARLGPQSAASPETNAEVYQLYRRARASEMQPGLRGVKDSIFLFKQVIAKDSSFAPAYAGLAAGQAARSAFDEYTPPERADMIAEGWAATAKAIQLNPRLADALEALGMMQAREGQWAQAERSFQGAIGLAPRDPLCREQFAAFLLLPLGRIDEAIGQLRIAERIDPLSKQAHLLLYTALRAKGRFDEADFHCHKAAQDDQQNSKCWAQALLRQGKAERAVAILEPVWRGHLLEHGAEALGVAYASAGRREDAERIAAIAPRPVARAEIFAALGDKDRTFEVLEQMVQMGPTRIGRHVLISPDFAFLRGDPRFEALRKKVGLPE